MKKQINVFESFTLPNGVTLKNRLLMAPMTTCTGFHDGTVTQDLIDYYHARSGSIGGIIVECGFVDSKGAAFPGALGLDHDDKITGLAKIAEAIKINGSKAIIQIYHGGRMVEPKFIGGQTPVAPSALAAPRPNSTVPDSLTANEVEEMINKFGEGVRRAILAGFDGIEIHGANTYLIQQFYSPNSNQRQDEWGGDCDRRSKFPLAVLDITIDMVKKYGSDNFIIGYRFSPEEIENPGIRFNDTLHLLEKLAKKRLDYVHFSMGDTLRSSLVETHDKTPLIDNYVARRPPNLARIPVIGVGNIVNLNDAEIALAHGYDLLAVGRACIAYPDWAERMINRDTLTLTIPSDEREIRKIPEPLWRFPLVESLIRDVNASGKKLKAGTYQEQVSDENNNYIINVELTASAIADLALSNASEYDAAVIDNFIEIKSRILQSGSPHVDAIAGATTQSEAFKKAVSKALLKSNKDAIVADGGNPDEKKADVVVIGSGGAGLAAAIEAHDQGADVLIIEKMPIIGGNTNKASAGMNAAKTTFQASQGIVDSKEQFYLETYKGGKYKNNKELLRYFVNHAPDAIDWLAQKGICLSGLTTTGGMSVKRTHRPENGAAVGGFLISGLIKNINKRHIEIHLDSEVTDIAATGDQWINVTINAEGGSKQIIQTRSVVVATGGFGANTSMIENYRPDLKNVVTTNHAGATGSGIKLLEKLGAGTIDMAAIQIHPTVEQTSSYLISESIRGGGAILISQEGKRFINELETRDEVSARVINLPEHYAYIVFDEQVKNDNKAVEEYLAQHFVTQAPTIPQLAQQLGINEAALAQTLAHYNEAVENGVDPEFLRTTGMNHKINTAPYYAIKIAPGIHHTMGGVTINTDTQVIDKKGKILPGIYAAGEVTGGLHGENRIGGNAVADIIIFGIKAGGEAARLAMQQTQ